MLGENGNGQAGDCRRVSKNQVSSTFSELFADWVEEISITIGFLMICQCLDSFLLYQCFGYFNKNKYLITFKS